MKFQPALYSSPIDLPEGTSGKLSVKHSTIEGRVTVIGQRQAWMRGLRPTVAMLDAPRRVHTLFEEGQGVWMTDLPEELNQIAEMLATVEPRGDVLIGGLGLGLAAHALLARQGVEEVVVVERSQDVINLCAQSLPCYVAHSDLLEFLKVNDDQWFDYYLLDTWQGTSESTWWEEVMPLRRVIRQNHGAKPVIHCWAEDIMIGQINKAIAHGNRSWYYECLPDVMSPASIRRFTRDVGLLEWEERYGKALDAIIAREQAALVPFITQPATLANLEGA